MGLLDLFKSGFPAVIIWWCVRPSMIAAIRPVPPMNPQDTEDGRALMQHLHAKEQHPPTTIVQSAIPGKMGLLVIPGLGRVDRLDTVIHNLRMLVTGGHLVKHGASAGTRRTWDCVIYIYADRNDPKTADFFAERDKLSFLSSYCQLKEHPNQFVTKNMWMVQPRQVQGKYQYVFVLLDDIKLLPGKQNTGGRGGDDRGSSTGAAGSGGGRGSRGSSGGPGTGERGTGIKSSNSRGSGTRHGSIDTPDSSLAQLTSHPGEQMRQRLLVGKRKQGGQQRGLRPRKMFDLTLFLEVMERNNLTAASPMVIGANKGGGQAFRTIMQRPAETGTLGFVSVFVELFAWMATVPAYVALWEILYPSVNPFGWGHDFWYHHYGLTRVPGHRTGVISTQRVFHEQDFSAPNGGRTDTTSVADKWGAVVAQERFYKKHFEIDLKHCRDHVGLANSSWNGAVKGYLY